MQQTLLFYDLETSGLEPGFDQLIQFAAIRTDLELNELERHEITARLSMDVVPAPAAVLTHQIDPSSFDQGQPEYEAVAEIHRILNTPGTLSGGYNTLGFDDEFLRFSFHRNLLPPYTHQYANGCGRFDLYPLAILYYLYAPEVCQWPEVEGRPSLKLEGLSMANQLAEGPAHQAIVDVEATVALARLFKRNATIWDFGFDAFNKAADEGRVQKVLQAQTDFKLGLLLSGKFGARCLYQAPALCLGVHQHYRNQSVWVRLDQPLGMEFSEWYVVKKKYAEAPLLLPYSERATRTLSEAAKTHVANNLAFLQANPEVLQAAKAQYLSFQYPEVARCDSDANLYQSAFPTYAETGAAQAFAAGDWGLRAAWVGQCTHKEMQLRSARVVARHAVQAQTKSQAAAVDDMYDVISQLPAAQQVLLRAWLGAVAHGQEDLVGRKAQARWSLQAALEEVEARIAQITDTTGEAKAHQLLLNLQVFLQGRMDLLKQVLAKS